MRVAVVTPYFDEAWDVLQRCHLSVVGQSFPAAAHVMVADGMPQPRVEAWPVQHFVLPRRYADFGNTPRAVGAVIALRQGFDAICFLDADCWYEPSHLHHLVRLTRETGAAVVTATRNLRRPDGSLLGVCDESDGHRFTDTNCYLMSSGAAGILPHWVLHNEHQAVVADRIVWEAVLQSGLRRAHCTEPTVNYTTRWAAHYLARGEQPPPGSKHIILVQGVPRSVRVDRTTA